MNRVFKTIHESLYITCSIVKLKMYKSFKYSNVVVALVRD